MLEAVTRTSFHHQPEAQHPKSSAIHKSPADYPIYWPILLKKSVFNNDPNFADAQVRFLKNDVGDLIINPPFNERVS
ncbi:MAG TPA: hypothetical protein VFU70_01675 [Pseudolabrys sp.]|nr:hypothetical protein [Pseudolabrys sp.]